MWIQFKLNSCRYIRSKLQIVYRIIRYHTVQVYSTEYKFNFHKLSCGLKSVLNYCTIQDAQCCN